ncbi:MAG: hypothetical protein DYG89_51580 [Caldilinea sp. CFX5]|nr:hypothetical protein [Caldilinea sp. CFX5]
MQTQTLTFIRSKQIDSFQKLVFLLFLHKNPEAKGTSQYFAEKMYLGNVTLIEKMITEFKERGIMASNEQHHFLQDTPEIRSSLQHLHQLFEQPTTRQSLLDQVRYSVDYHSN